MKAKNYTKLWQYIDSLKLNLPKCEKTEILQKSGDVVTVFVRCYKPRNCGY